MGAHALSDLTHLLSISSLSTNTKLADKNGRYRITVCTQSRLPWAWIDFPDGNAKPWNVRKCLSSRTGKELQSEDLGISSHYIQQIISWRNCKIPAGERTQKGEHYRLQNPRRSKVLQRLLLTHECCWNIWPKDKAKKYATLADDYKI